MDDIVRNILIAMKDKSITAAQLQRDLKLYASAVSEWKNGSSRSYLKHLPKLAEYLGVSTDFLLGNKPIVPNPYSQYFFNGDEKVLLSIYRGLDREHQIKLMANAYSYRDLAKNTGTSGGDTGVV